MTALGNPNGVLFHLQSVRFDANDDKEQHRELLAILDRLRREVEKNAERCEQLVQRSSALGEDPEVVRRGPQRSMTIGRGAASVRARRKGFARSESVYSQVDGHDGVEEHIPEQEFEA